MGRICVVDDNEMLRDSVAETLTRDDHVVSTFSDPAEALRAIKAGTFDCHRLPGVGRGDDGVRDGGHGRGSDEARRVRLYSKTL